MAVREEKLARGKSWAHVTTNTNTVSVTMTWLSIINLPEQTADGVRFTRVLKQNAYSNARIKLQSAHSFTEFLVIPYSYGVVWCAVVKEDGATRWLVKNSNY